MLTLLSSGQGQSGTYVELMLQAYKFRVYAEAGVFEAESCLSSFLGNLSSYKIDENTEVFRNYSARVFSDSGTVEGSQNVISGIESLRNSYMLDRTTLALFPSGVKAGKAYSVLPENGNGDLTVVRNTTSTTFNSSRVLVSAEPNVPRLTYLTVGGNPFLLSEVQDTNTSNFSEDLTNAFYNNSDCSVVSVSEINPRGLLSVSKVIPNTLSNQHFISSTNNKKVLSVFAKANGYSTVVLFFTVHNAYVIFNALTGAILFTNGSATGQVEVFANGYFRFSAITTLDTHFQSRVYVINGTTFNDRVIAGNGVDGVNVFGHQTSDILTSYIPSLGAAATTRNADVITITPSAETLRITTTFSDNTAQILTTIPVIYTVPKGIIKSIVMNNDATNYLLETFLMTTGAAYSLRKLTSTITNVVRIRRSLDNIESDFTAEQITNGTLLTFCGLGSGFVTTWYDQSGNNAHTIQTTAANQPFLVINGVVNLENGKPAIVFDGTNDFLSFNGEVLNKGSFLAFTVAKNLKTAGISRIFDQSSNNGGAVLNVNGNEELFGITSAGNVVINRGSGPLIQASRTSQILSGNSKMRQNGGNEINNTNTFTMSGNTGVSFIIGENSPANNQSFQGTLQEIVIYTTNNDVNIAEIETQINNYYSIY